MGYGRGNMATDAAAPARGMLFCLFALLLVLGLGACSQGSAGSKESGQLSESQSQSQSHGAGESSSPEAVMVNSDGAVPSREKLLQFMDAQDADKLLAGAQTNVDRYWIAAHPEDFDMEGEAVQTKLLRLAADEDEALAYVREFPERYPDADEKASGNASAAAAQATGSAFPAIASGNAHVPHLYQWDQRWGYTVYSSTAFGLTGCGPTALAMAYQGVTGNDDLSPYDMGQLAQQMGYMAEYEGTDPYFLIDASAGLGMYSEELVLEEASLRSAFADGCAVIANVGNGYFSHYGGHFLVLTGFTSDGKLVMNDPYSAVNSLRTWDVDFILGETMGLYAFWKLPGDAEQ